MKRNSVKKKKVNSILILAFCFTFVVIGLSTFTAKKPRADFYALDSIELQIAELEELNYSPKEIKKIVKMTNSYADLYIAAYEDRIVIGTMLPNDDVTNVRIIEMGKK